MLGYANIGTNDLEKSLAFYDKVLAVAFVAVVLTVDGLSCHGFGYLDRLRENRCLVFGCLKLLPFSF